MGQAKTPKDKRIVVAGKKIDVYAFAMLGWALLRWRTPFAGQSTMHILSQVCLVFNAACVKLHRARAQKSGNSFFTAIPGRRFQRETRDEANHGTLGQAPHIYHHSKLEPEPPK